MATIDPRALTLDSSDLAVDLTGHLGLSAAAEAALAAMASLGDLAALDVVAEANLSLSDVTTADVSTAKHGFCPKLPNDPAKFLNGQGGFTLPGVPVLLATVTASNSAAVAFTTGINGTYNRYAVRIRNLLPANNAVTLNMRISTDGGTTWKSGGTDYNYGEDHVLGNGAAGGTGGTGSSIKFMSGLNSGSQLSNVTGRVGHFTLELLEPANASNFFLVQGEGLYHTADTATYILNRTYFGGRYATAGAINGIQFFCSSGNISAGTFELYGIP